MDAGVDLFEAVLRIYVSPFEPDPRQDSAAVFSFPSKQPPNLSLRIYETLVLCFVDVTPVLRLLIKCSYP